MKIIYILFLLIIFSACKPMWNKLQTPGKNPYNVEFLFEHDGGKVYRFTDDFKYVYFTNCNNEAIGMQGDSVISHTLIANDK